MSKFVIESNKVYDVNFCSFRFFIRVIERCNSDYKVEIAYYPDFDDFSYFDLNFRVFIFNEFDLSCLFGPFVFDVSLEADEEVEYEEA